MKRLIADKNNIPLENKIKQLEDIFEHKQYLLTCCYKLSKYLLTNGNDQDSLELMKRAFTHDISKLQPDEFYGMAEFVNDMDALKDPKAQITERKQKAIQLHWDRNDHHPEYWKKLEKTSDLAIMELACDWQARSLQFGTNSIDFLIERQESRFHFPQEIYDKIEKYLKILQRL